MKLYRTAVAALAAAAMLAGCKSSSSDEEQAAPTEAIPVDTSIEAAISEKIAAMTIEQKAGQMVQITLDALMTDGKLDSVKLDDVIGRHYVGSILNVSNGRAFTLDQCTAVVKAIQQKSLETMGIPCIYGLDMIHGATYYEGATFFPHEIGLGATFNPAFATAMGESIAYETRAGLVPWVFSPVMDLGRDPRWPRMYESWGEDSYLQSVMAVAETKAIQGDDPNHVGLQNVAVSLKHYMGYGVPYSGMDRTPAVITEADLREKYFRPFKECIEAGALTVMVNSAAINGVPTHANKTLLTGWLKEGLDWDGMVVTDWADIDNLYVRDHVAADKKDALRIGINAGIDMVMDPYDAKAVDLIVELANEGLIPMERIDDAVARVLRLKYRVGLFENPVWNNSKKDYPDYGSKRFVAQARQAALESIVLLKNDNHTLPIRKGTKIIVTGPNAKSVRTLNGGWSYSWQGSGVEDLFKNYHTIYDAIRAKFGAENVEYISTVEYNNSNPDNWQAERCLDSYDMAPVIERCYDADLIICCVGENTYCETPGNINDLNLSAAQRNMVYALQTTETPVLLILNEGRPRVLGSIARRSKAIVDVMLPGNYGADALASLLAGEANFSGRLPFTYPAHTNALHTYDYKVCESRETMAGAYNYDAVLDVQWPFGYGLSYTTYEYSQLTCNKPEFRGDDMLEFKVVVGNTGKKAGKNSVLLYSSDLLATTIPDVKRLRAFYKVELQPGQRKRITLKVPASDLAYVGTDGKWILEEGDFRISVGDQSIKIRCTETHVWDDPNKKDPIVREPEEE